MMVTAGAIPFRTADEIGRAIPDALAQLGRRGVLAYPTETVYGFGGAVDAESIAALRRIKGRDEKSFLLLISDRAMLHRFAARIPEYAEALMAQLWPGPLTLIFRAVAALPAGVVGQTGGVAVRWTSHSGVARLIAAHGDAITSTSANVAGAAPARDVAPVLDHWAAALGRGELRVLDGGMLEPSAPSTIVDCTGPRPTLVRAGAIATATLRAAAPALVGSA